jgi:hypothetical protein
MLAAGIAACDRGSSDLQWARAALERNPQVKVVSVDEERNTIELRIVATDKVVVVTPGELAALPISDLVALQQRPMAEIAPPTAIPAETPVPVSEPPAAPAETLAVTPPEPAPMPPTAYTVEREDGRVKVTGPGISIETAEKSASTATAVRARNDDPLICDGKRFLRVDARQLNVTGDAIVVRNGCELHISNSRISASGTAIVVANATVHISNSELQGDEAALNAGAGSRVFIRNDTFNGVVRRDPQATLQDQGGNTWR